MFHRYFLRAYRAAVREGADIVWYCASCHGNPIAENTRDGETSADVLGSEEFNSLLDSSADNFQDQSTEVPVQSTVAESVTADNFDQSTEVPFQSTVAESVTTEPDSSAYDHPVQPTIDESAI